MAAFRDTTESIGEPKNARMEQRTKPHVKATIQRAAALMGIDETAFVVTAAFDRAREVIEARERTLLTEADAKLFFQVLDNPPEPTEALIELARLRGLVRNRE